MSTPRPVCILVAALGGQGGGVLAEWMTDAARIDGLQAQATSIPGVAQRTGATTYYFEIYPQADLPSRPVFSIYPASGAVDLLVAFEPMEAARALSGGFVGPETTVLTAQERVLSTAEKVKPGNGALATGPVLAALKRCAGSLKVVNITEVARKAGCHPNAIMFGAMAASGVLPVKLASCRGSIINSSTSGQANIAGFEVGLKLADQPVMADKDPVAPFSAAPPEFVDQILRLPEQLRPLAGHAAAQLLDYQDAAYVCRYIDPLQNIAADDDGARDYRLSLLVARNLARWMAYEDVIRVAALKTRGGRMARIRAELGVEAEVPLTVYDYLKPGREELSDVLPEHIVNSLPSKRSKRGAGGIPLRLKTSGPLAWAALRLLAAIKPWRMRTARFHRENRMIEAWLKAIGISTAVDYELACQTAELAVWARGYGDVRRRGLAHLSELLDGWPSRVADEGEKLHATVAASLARAHTNPDVEVA